MRQNRWALGAFLLLTAIGVGRIGATYRPISQTSDETPNIACGMQWLNLGRYDYGPFHPPLARIAMAIGPYLYGARSQGKPDRWPEGNAVLNSAPRYGKALTLAREGILPFFVLACACVWLWSRRLLGEWGALAALFLFTNLPPVLAHAGVATSDMAVGAGVCAAVYAWTLWLEQSSLRRSVFLGVAVALAFLSKFSSVLVVPACFAAVLALRGWQAAKSGGLPRLRIRTIGVSLLVAALLVWSAYRFSWGHMTEKVAEDASWQGGIWARIPPSWLHALERMPVPAPAILDGMWQVHNHVEGGHPAYLLGRNSSQGWWYFFPVALGVKTPLGVLLLAAVGLFALFREKLRKFDWRYWAPPAAAAAILLACLPATLNIGVRYMLPLYPMLALVAGMGAVWLFQRRGRVAPAAAAVLMLWTAVSSWAAHPDYLAYFNEIAGRNPERILVDSDLDWGQDMGLLAKELKRRRVEYFHMRCMFTGDDTKLGLPFWDGLDPYRPVKGWVAVSFTMLKTYSWVAAQERGRTDNGFAWLERYQPVARVGRSILLYYIP
ncbi:MAG: glycosyltransferase family 39 protein [Acidobacteriia bacterium]|nr:glycosyltransferase family 39 protein [Terriglobia bacterium]